MRSKSEFFLAFLIAKPATKGKDLGLSLSHDGINAHGRELIVETSFNAISGEMDAVFKIILPLPV